MLTTAELQSILGAILESLGVTELTDEQKDKLVILVMFAAIRSIINYKDNNTDTMMLDIDKVRSVYPNLIGE